MGAMKFARTLASGENPESWKRVFERISFA